MSLKAKSLLINGKAIDKDGVSGILITLQDWQKLTTSDNSEDRIWQHGRLVSPSYARIRTITLEWILDRIWNTNELNAIRYLERLLSLQADPSNLIPLTLYIKDSYDREWNLSVKVKEPIEFVEWDNMMAWSHWSWRAVLESTWSPLYTENNEQSISSEEAWYGGFTIPFTIPFTMNNTINSISIIPTESGIVRPRIVVTANRDINAPLKVVNITTGKKFELNVSAVAWDIITIDAYNRKCYKNDSDITSLRIVWSVWPSVSWDGSDFRIEGADGWTLWSDFTVTFYYRNTL